MNYTGYKIEIDKKNKKRMVAVIDSSNIEIFQETIERKDEEKIPENWFDSLSHAQKNTLRALLDESKPNHNLISSDSTPLEIGSFKFINNSNLIARAIIETLYQLRNALFHGEITPDLETQEIYQPAYLILKSIIPGK